MSVNFLFTILMEPLHSSGINRAHVRNHEVACARDPRPKKTKKCRVARRPWYFLRPGICVPSLKNRAPESE
jgi:hypothetical protein